MPMKNILLIFCLLISFYAEAQLYITKTYSQNGKYCLESVPYDSQYPSLRGKTTVFKNGKVQYVLDRSFDADEHLDYKTAYLTISNDGKFIAYFLSAYHPGENEQLKNVTVYKNGKLIKTYSLKEFAGCGKYDDNCCDLIYSNFNYVVDDKKSRASGKFKKVYSDEVSKEEIFLFENMPLTYNDRVYMTDSRMMTTVFDLKTAKIIDRQYFSKLYPKLKFQKQNMLEYQFLEIPNFEGYDFPSLQNGEETASVLASYLGIKKMLSGENSIYKSYTIEVKAFVDKEGKIEIVELDADEKVSLEKIRAFLEQQTYDTKFLPIGIDKFYWSSHWYFRNANDSLAENERQVAIKENELRENQKAKLDSIENMYVLKNISATFLESQQLLSNTVEEKITGKYNNILGNSLILNPDSTFVYKSGVHSLVFWAKGKWTNRKNIIYLNPIAIYDTLRISGKEDVLELSNSERSNLIKGTLSEGFFYPKGYAGRQIITQLKYFYIQGKIIEINQDGKLETEMEGRSWSRSKRKYNPWMIKIDG